MKKSGSMLFKRIYGSLIGSAIGDAMGGPVELWPPQKIQEIYGTVEDLLPYEHTETGIHGSWDRTAGSYTDDSRLAKIYCRAIAEKGGIPTDKDLGKAFIDYYYHAEDKRAREFIEEYYFKAIYREDKEIFGGQPTNGAIMAATPFGVINSCNSRQAFIDAFKALFMGTGYARYSAAIAAAAIASAMKPESNVENIIEESLKAAEDYKEGVEGELWRNWGSYDKAAGKNEQLIRRGLEISEKYRDPDKFRERLRETISQEFFADGSETLAIALTMFYRAEGDYRETVKLAVNFGRDNDSSACVAGAIAGAYQGVDAIPGNWIETVERVNPEPTFEEYAGEITDIVRERHEKWRVVVNNIDMMLD